MSTLLSEKHRCPCLTSAVIPLTLQTSVFGANRSSLPSSSSGGSCLLFHEASQSHDVWQHHHSEWEPTCTSPMKDYTVSLIWALIKQKTKNAQRLFLFHDVFSFHLPLYMLGWSLPISSARRQQWPSCHLVKPKEGEILLQRSGGCRVTSRSKHAITGRYNIFLDVYLFSVDVFKVRAVLTSQLCNLLCCDEAL